MNILYLHELDATPGQEKIAALEKLGHRVVAPTLDYRAGAVFEDLLSVARREFVDALIGVGMGGHVARHLADELQKPALLFNPAGPQAPAVAQFQPLAEARAGYRHQTVVVGHLDTAAHRIACYNMARRRGYRLHLLQEVGSTVDRTVLLDMFYAFAVEHALPVAGGIVAADI
jgi:predicted esterase YcpF (UPF0227 family)